MHHHPVETAAIPLALSDALAFTLTLPEYQPLATDVPLITGAKVGAVVSMWMGGNDADAVFPALSVTIVKTVCEPSPSVREFVLEKLPLSDITMGPTPEIPSVAPVVTTTGVVYHPVEPSVPDEIINVAVGGVAS